MHQSSEQAPYDRHGAGHLPGWQQQAGPVPERRQEEDVSWLEHTEAAPYAPHGRPGLQVRVL